MTRILLGLAVYLVFFSPLLAQSGAPIVTDSRVKTFVYNENDVFTILTHYGYQSNIEFANNETVKTVSVGDRVAWQVIPAGRRLFIKAMEEKAHTNMTVVTNKRAYQFDLRASGAQPLHPNEELVYVVRFYYPSDNPSVPTPPIYSDAPHVSPLISASAPMPAVQAAPMPAVHAAPLISSAGALNYQYTFTGPTEAAPVKIYDDGMATYFTFAPGSGGPMEFFVLGPDGRESPVPVSFNQSGEAVVAAIAPRFSIRRGGANIMVYNERMSGGQVM